MNVVFAGTPEFAARSLAALLDSAHRVTAVLTRPDRPAGRGRKCLPGPVKTLARDRGIAVHQPATLKDAGVLELLQSLDMEVMVVAAYGLILPSRILEIPRFGCLNIHASLLPRWRGAAPIQRAIEAGDERTGISIMQMDAGLDTGAVLMSRDLPIDPADTAASLHDKLAVMGAESIVPALDALARGELEAHPQDESLSTYAARLDPRESVVDWTLPARRIVNKIHAFNPWPGAKTGFRGTTLKLLRAEWLDSRTGGPPGTVSIDGKNLLVQSGRGLVRLVSVQKPGGRPISAADFLNSSRPRSGERLS